VLLLEPAPTPYDLRWRMFGTPVRVHPMFWVVAVWLGWDFLAEGGLGYLLLWVVCVFVSLLVHEFGHVWMGRLFGAWGYIVLYTFGGLAVGSKDLRRRWQRIAVSLAGPLLQLLLYVAAALASGLDHRYHFTDGAGGAGPYILEAIGMMILINFYWPLLNLLPVWPLDGGQVAREVCEAVFGRMGVSVSLGISLFVSALLVLHVILSKPGRPFVPFLPPLGLFMALFFALFCASSFLALRAENQRLRRQGSDDWRWRG
jgi:stage IV sporulation protein FB